MPKVQINQHALFLIEVVLENSLERNPDVRQLGPDWFELDVSSENMRMLDLSKRPNETYSDVISRVSKHYMLLKAS